MIFFLFFFIKRKTKKRDTQIYVECDCHVCVFQARTKELEGLQPKVEELQAQVQSMEGTKGWFERRLKEAEVSLTADRLPSYLLPAAGRSSSDVFEWKHSPECAQNRDLTL